MKTLLTILLLLFISCTKDELPLEINTMIGNYEESLESDFKILPPGKVNKILALDEKEFSNQILDYINDCRNEDGLPDLINNKTAKIEAISHSYYQANMGQINHENYKFRFTAIVALENATYYGENVGYGYYNADRLVDAWCNSLNHKTNIVLDFTHTGIGTVANDKGVLYFTQIFYK